MSRDACTDIGQDVFRSSPGREFVGAVPSSLDLVRTAASRSFRM